MQKEFQELQKNAEGIQWNRIRSAKERQTNTPLNAKSKQPSE